MPHLAHVVVGIVSAVVFVFMGSLAHVAELDCQLTSRQLLAILHPWYAGNNLRFIIFIQ
jgi:hypothetical protein